MIDGIIGLKYHLGGHIKMNKQINKKLNKPQELLIEMLEIIYRLKK